MLGVVGSNLKMVKFQANTALQHVATRRNRVAKRAQQCYNMLRWHVEIVWPGFYWTDPRQRGIYLLNTERAYKKDTPPWKNKIMKLKSKNSIIFLNFTPEAIVHLVRQKVLLTYDRNNFSSS